MAYSGTTAASSLQNPPVKIAQGMANLSSTLGAVVGATSPLRTVGGTGLWVYQSLDGATITSSIAYFTDGDKLGMRQGDFILIAAATAAGSTAVGMALGMLMTTNSTAGWNTALLAQNS